MFPLLSLLSALALGASLCDDTLYWSHGTPPTPHYDDENCFVEVPQGVPFVYDNNFYTQSSKKEEISRAMTEALRFLKQGLGCRNGRRKLLGDDITRGTWALWGFGALVSYFSFPY